jgi:Trp operon repressor
VVLVSAPEKHRENGAYRWVAERPVAVALAALAIGIVVSFFVTRSEVSDVGSRVTKVESPCLRYGPDSQQCKEAFEAAIATITHAQACAVERKAGTLKAIRELAASLEVRFKEPCAGARIAQERQRGNEREASARAGDGGTAAPASTQTDSDQAPAPSSPGTGGAVGPGKGGSGGGAAPGSGDGGNGAGAAPTSPEASVPPSAPTPPEEKPSAPTSSALIPETIKATTEGVAEVVGKAGAAVQGSVEGRGKALGGRD